MNIRIWSGGLLITILFVAVLMTMGCEKGALGVKGGASLVGRLVDSDDPTIPIVGAKVRIYSAAAVAAEGGGIAVGQDMFTGTDDKGYFSFGNIRPDCLNLSASHAKYSPLLISGTSTASSTVGAFWIQGADTMNIGDLAMIRYSDVPTTANITVKGRILDGKSFAEFADTQVLSLYFDNTKYQNRDITYSELKTGLTVSAKSTPYTINILCSGYFPFEDTTQVAGNIDCYVDLRLTPIRNITVKAKIVDGSTGLELADNTTMGAFFDGGKFLNRDVTYLELKNGLSVPPKIASYTLSISGTVVTKTYTTSPYYDFELQVPGYDVYKTTFDGSYDQRIDVTLTNQNSTVATVTILVKGKITDYRSKSEFATGQNITIYFDDVKYQSRTITYAEFKNGLTIDSKVGNTNATYTLSIISDGYNTYRSSFYGATDGILDIQMMPSSFNILVRGKILSSGSKNELGDNEIISIYFDGGQYQNRDITYSEFKGGLVLPGKIGSMSMKILVQNYFPYNGEITGDVDNILNIELKSISYEVRVTLRNKPTYMDDKFIELESKTSFAFITDEPKKCTLTITSAEAENGQPYKILGTAAVSLNPYEPEAVIGGISLPASLTVLLSGYKEMEFPVPFTPDTQGMIAMKLNLETGGVSYGTTISDQMITRPTVVTLNPDADDSSFASGPINLWTNDPVRIRCLDRQWGLAPLQTFDAEATFPSIRRLPCGYILPFEIYAQVAHEGATGLEFHCTNYYYIEPTRMATWQNPASTATFTAKLLLSRNDFVVRP